MKREALSKVFVQLGKVLESVGNKADYPGYEIGVTSEEYEKLNYLVQRQVSYNGWFTEQNVRDSFSAWADLLSQEKLTNWAEHYSYANSPKRVCLVMAGNIPLVGFHDLLSVVFSGHTAVCKLSSDDNTLIPHLMETVIGWLPEVKERFEVTLGNLKNIDAVIATGSNNSQNYFQQYFGKYPHIFRKNRTSVALLTGEETKEELHDLGTDIFKYYGLGCRNVSHLMFPKGYELKTFFEGIYDHHVIIYHKKYGNNYDYNKAIFLMNKENLFDNNFLLLRESKDLFSQLAMLNYHYYDSIADAQKFLIDNDAEIQVKIGSGHTPFGQAQKPDWFDYADGVDTREWLERI